MLHVTKADGSTIDTDLINQVNSITVGNQPKVPFIADAQKGNITFTPPPNLSGPQTVQLLDKDGKPLGQAQLTAQSPAMQAQEANSRSELNEEVKVLDTKVRALQAAVKVRDTEVRTTKDEVQLVEAEVGALQNEIAKLSPGTNDATKDAELGGQKFGTCDQEGGTGDQDPELTNKNAELETKKSQLNKLNNVSENPLRDILSERTVSAFTAFRWWRGRSCWASSSWCRCTECSPCPSSTRPC